MPDLSAPMMKMDAPDLLEKLDRLRTELVELAYTLDTRGRRDAADVAITTSARVGELCAEFTAELSPERRPGTVASN